MKAILIDDAWTDIRHLQSIPKGTVVEVIGKVTEEGFITIRFSGYNYMIEEALLNYQKEKEN